MKNILVLDDDAEILQCIRIALNTRGYKCTTTNTFKDFFQTFKEEAFALVLLDVHMPRKSGFSVFKELRRDKHIPVLFITAYAGSFTLKSKSVLALWQKEFSDGDTDILYKPFSLDDLYGKVEALIGPPEDQK